MTTFTTILIPVATALGFLALGLGLFALPSPTGRFRTGSPTPAGRTSQTPGNKSRHEKTRREAVTE
jgi:hypothetical protein